MLTQVTLVALGFSLWCHFSGATYQLSMCVDDIPQVREINVRACSRRNSLANRILSIHVFSKWCIDRFRKCRWSETLTFGAGYICDAFWFRETCRDPPFTAVRPFLTEADVENEHGGASFVTGRRPTLESRAEGQHTPNPTCVYISALPGCWSRDFSKCA